MTNIRVLRQSRPGPEPVQSYLRTDAEVESAASNEGAQWTMTTAQALLLAWQIRTAVGGAAAPSGPAPAIPAGTPSRPWEVEAAGGIVSASRTYEDVRSVGFQATVLEALEYADSISNAAAMAESEMAPA